MNAEATALSQLAFNGHMTTVRLGYVFDDGQSQTGSAQVATARFVHPIEALKDPWQMLLGDTHAVINHPDDHLVILSLSG